MENKEYIKSLAGPENWISEEMAKLACELVDEWKYLGIEVTQIAPGPDGMLGFYWRFKDFYFNLDLFPDGKRELFWENLLTAEMWSADYPDNNQYVMITFICKLQEAIKDEKEVKFMEELDYIRKTFLPTSERFDPSQWMTGDRKIYFTVKDLFNGWKGKHFKTSDFYLEKLGESNKFLITSGVACFGEVVLPKEKLDQVEITDPEDIKQLGVTC